MAAHTHTAPDIKKPYDTSTPSLPAIAILLPILLYVWFAFTAFSVAKEWWEVRALSNSFPLEQEERQILEAQIADNQKITDSAEAQFATFRRWKGWVTESPALSPLIAATLNVIGEDVRINTLSITKSMEAPNQIKLIVQIASSKTDASKQFQMILTTLDALGWTLGGGIETSEDEEGAKLYPTPAGAARELFYKLDATLIEKVDLTSPVVPISGPDGQPVPLDGAVDVVAPTP